MDRDMMEELHEDSKDLTVSCQEGIIKYLVIVVHTVLTLGLIILLYFEFNKMLIIGWSTNGMLCYFIISALAICFVGYWSWISIASACAKYKFETLGIIVNYPLGISQYVSWYDLQQVCICHADYTTRGPARAKSVICFVKKGEKKNVYGRWKTDNLLHYKSVMRIYYTQELYEKIQEKCPYDIPDLRQTRAYKL